MTALTIRAAVLQALTVAAPKGMTTDDLLDAVTRLRGSAPQTRNSVPNAISEINVSGLAVIRSEKRHLTRHYTLVSAGRPERLEVNRHGEVLSDAFQAAPDLPAPRSITAAIFGDPLPGRSAWDQRHRPSA